MPKKKIELSKPEPLNTYGFEPQPNFTQFHYDAAAFAKRLGISYAPTRWELFQKIANFITPGLFEWHDWTERAIKPLIPDLEDKKVCVLRALPGASGSAKTFNITAFACVWWMMQPDESSVTLVSTTKNMLRRRAWAVVQKVYSSLRDGQKFGNLVDSRTIWQAEKADDKHAIVAQAVEEGAVQKVVDNLKGVHTRRQMIIIDEATSIPRAIYEAIDNLYSYPDEFIVAVLGNPWNRLDNFGLFCEPDKGWNSVTVETGEWEAKPFAHCGGVKPHVITFDAEKSPNILEGRIVSRHLPKKDEVEQAKKNSNGGNTPHYWQNKRGFWPPEGLIQTVFSESMFSQFDSINGRHEFLNNSFTIIGVIDQSKGGDNACLRFAQMGSIQGGIGIQLMKPIMLDIDPHKAGRAPAYQLFDQIKQKCARIDMGGGKFCECRPECFGVDDSADSALGDVLYQNWSHAIHRIVFQGSASDEAISLEDTRPANEVYHNKRAEMYFYSRSATVSGQIKGYDVETCKELCSIEYDGSKKRIVLQDKHEYRAKHGNQSPDRADSSVMVVEIARRRGFFLKATGETKKVIQEIEQGEEKLTELFYEENMYQMEEVESFHD